MTSRPARRARSWLRRQKLRTRILAGVLLVTLLALVVFDIAAVTALRGYLLGQTDARLQSVLGLYRVTSLTVSGPRTSLFPSRPVKPLQFGPKFIPAGPHRSVIVGPRLLLPSILGQYYVASVSGRGLKLLVGGNPDLRPQLPADLRHLAASQRARSVSSRGGRAQLRLLAESLPGSGIVYVTTSLGSVNRTVGQLELILATGSAAAGLLAAGGAAWVMRRGLRPIETITAQADRITAGGLTDRVSAQDSRTEVGRLGAALNGMLARIEDSIREREATQEAARRFFADASHELRTPLASLRANAELYQQGALPHRPQVDEAMRRIVLEARRMGRLVDDMLRLARLDQHPGRQYEPVDLTALVTECAERARIADPGRAWRADISAGLVTVGDEELLRRAIDNLLANVEAHTPAGTAATVRARHGAGSVAIEVCDNGPGVPADQLSRIFDRFYRAGTHSHASGSGLGLAIVIAIAAAHDGRAEAALNDPQGLRVTLTLPERSAGASGTEPPAPAAGQGARLPDQALSS